MKIKQAVGTAIYIIAFFLNQSSTAQSVVTYLDNTSQPITGSQVLSGLAFQIATGTNDGGYALNDIQLLFSDAVGTPISGQYLLIYILTDNSGSFGTGVAALSTTAYPVTSGLYTFTTLHPATLASGSNYWMFIGVSGASSFGNYQLAYTDTTTAMANDGWLITGTTKLADGIPIFSIDATPVPEPSALAFMSLGFLAAFWTGVKHSWYKATPIRNFNRKYQINNT